MNKYLFILCLASVSFWAQSCTDYGAADSLTEENEIEVFNGSVLDYLLVGNDRLNLKFDSMMFLIDSIPDFKQLLQEGGKQYTIFAVPDACFRFSLSQLAEYRKQKELGGPISLSDLLIEPFVVEDTVIIGATTTLPDTTITEYYYDYRAEVEAMLCRYIIDAKYDTDSILADGGNAVPYSLKYNYQMNIECFLQPASGYSDGGAKRMIFSDMKNSQVKENWNNASVVWMDIYASNGVIHILSPQHNFGFDEFINVFNNYGNEYKK
jgi:hypothetical protein